MKNSIKGLLIAMVAATTCGLVTAPYASADTIITTTTYSTMPVFKYDVEPNTVILTERAVIDTSPVIERRLVTAPAVIDTLPVFERQVITQPALIRTEPMWRDRSLFRIGVPGLLNLNLF